MGSQLAVTVIFRDCVHVCSVRGENRVALLILGNAPSIVDAVDVEVLEERRSEH